MQFLFQHGSCGVVGVHLGPGVARGRVVAVRGLVIDTGEATVQVLA